jgi:hypothetical protein
MSLAPAKFKVDEEISFSGKPMRVAGLVQYEGANAKISTRYLLTEATGAPVILEENGTQFSLLRPFPPTAQPQAAGGTVTVMGTKYALSGVRKLKVLGAAGQPPGGTPKAELLLSGLFEGEMGALVREMAPGAGAQTFYSLKPVHADEVLTSAQRAEVMEAQRLAAEAKAQAEEEGEDSTVAGTPFMKTVVWIVVIVVVVGLGFACSGSDDEGGSSGSARSSFSAGGGHGGK